MDYEVRQYQPARESAFSDTGLESELEEAFNQGYEEAYENYQDAMDGVDPLENMMPRPGDVATVENLGGSINLVELGFQIPANMRYPANYQGIRVTPTMSVQDYINWYFAEFTQGQHMIVIQNQGVGASPEITPPVYVGSKVMIADYLDSEGNSVDLPPGVVVVANAPPANLTEFEDNDNEIVRNYAKDRKSEWYCFLLESNLNIYQDIQITDETYMVNNFDGEYSVWLKKEDGDSTRSVSEFVEDRINNRFVPAGFGIGSRGKISSSPIIGAVEFTNDRNTGRGNPEWNITLLPGNLTTLAGAPLTPDQFIVVPEIRVDTVVLSKRPTRVDSTISERVWVNVKSGKTKTQNDAPGSIWAEAPQITIQGTRTISTLDKIADILETQGITVSRDTTAAGRVIGLEISDNAIRQELMSSVAPVVLDGTIVRYG